MLARAEEEDEFSFRGEETYFTNPKILQKLCVIVSQGNRVTRANFDEEEEEEEEGSENRKQRTQQLSFHDQTFREILRESFARARKRRFGSETNGRPA